MRVLIFSESVTLAHFFRPLMIARKLQAEGHEVLFAVTNSKFIPVKELEGTHHVFLDTPVIPSVFGHAVEYGKHPYTEKILNDYHHDEMRLINSFQPDIILGDMRLSLYVTAQVAKIPYVNITNSYWDHSAIVPRRFPMLKDSGVKDNFITRLFYDFLSPIFMNKLARPFNQFAKKHGCRVYGDYKKVLTEGTYSIYCDYKDLVTFKETSPNKKIIGPYIYENTTEIPQELKERSNKKRIFVGLGSSGPSVLLKDMIEVLNNVDAEVIICSPDKSLRALGKDHIKFYDFLPYSQIAKYVDLFICNGGSSIVYASLLSAVPVMMIPINFDQVIFSSLIEGMGAGVVLRFDEFKKERFDSHLRNLLNFESFKKQSLAFANEVKEINPLENIIKEIKNIHAEVSAK